MNTDQLQNTQILVEKGPISFVAAFFALAFFVQLGLYVRAVNNHRVKQSESDDKHSNEMLEMYKTHIERFMQLQTVCIGVIELTRVLQELVAAQRNRRVNAPKSEPKALEVVK